MPEGTLGDEGRRPCHVADQRSLTNKAKVVP